MCGSTAHQKRAVLGKDDLKTFSSECVLREENAMAILRFRQHDPDANLKRVQRKFRILHNRFDRRTWLRQLPRRLIRPLMTIVLLAGVAFTALHFSPWPALVTIKHIVSFYNCNATREMGLAPARRGRPGYWSKNDRDNDGIACELYYTHSRN